MPNEFLSRFPTHFRLTLLEAKKEINVTSSSQWRQMELEINFFFFWISGASLYIGFCLKPKTPYKFFSPKQIYLFIYFYIKVPSFSITIIIF